MQGDSLRSARVEVTRDQVARAPIRSIKVKAAFDMVVGRVTAMLLLLRL